MGETFVPLRAREGARTAEVAALAAVAEHRRLTIVGPPGSGKSMLLKHIALKWATGALAELPENPIPVLLELRHCSGETKPLREHLIDELEKRNRFPSAGLYLDVLLGSGQALLLLDGLDEVASGKEPGQRDDVVRQIRALLQQYHRCPVIITCRSAVYREEFADLVDQRLEIVEFSDQEMYSFLSHWEEHMPPGHSVAQLMAAMGARPRIKHIARNPLMLTIIAVLYEDPKFVLPHSRAEFYQEATEVLLRHHHFHRNRFPAPVKRRILQHLAVFNQLNAMKGSDQDRRSMSFDDVLREVRTMLPDLHLDAGEADRVLQEIVERSGLLLSIDGGERYQFAHLTLQEYFAADRLQNDYAQLFEHFAQDPDGWLEPVKLWCGLASNSSALIEKVHGIHPLAAFECLADAQEVETELADRILDEFTPALADESRQDGVLTAFSAVAADQRPRGRRVLSLLAECLSSDESVKLRAGADALAATNLLEAAEILGWHYQASSECREALLRMGDLTVSALGRMASDGDAAAMGQLRVIGTPAAAASLASMLWHQDQRTARAAAWNLAGLIANPAIESALARIRLDPMYRDAQAFPCYDWVWAPFVEDTGSPLIPIMGRMAFLMDHSPDDELPAEHFQIDERLAYALALLGSPGGFDRPNIYESRDEFERYAELWKMAGQRTLSVYINEWEVARLFRAIKDDPALTAKALAGLKDWLSTCPLFWTLVNSIPEKSRGHFIEKTVIPSWRRRATEGDWRNIFRPVSFSYEESWLFRGQLVLFLLVSLGVAIPAGLELAQVSVIFSWPNAWLLMKMLVLPITILWLLFWTFSWRSPLEAKLPISSSMERLRRRGSMPWPFSCSAQ